eukprot:10837705-Lingulodinium_polyedra.AAC.1
MLRHLAVLLGPVLVCNAPLPQIDLVPLHIVLLVLLGLPRQLAGGGASCPGSASLLLACRIFGTGAVGTQSLS